MMVIPLKKNKNKNIPVLCHFTEPPGSGIGTVRVGFDQDRYSVGEGDEYLEACIVIFSGELLGDLCLTFSTDYDTATRKDA